jgi:heme-degrading monooxygenase HmoA
MLRSVIMVALKPGTTEQQIEAFRAALAAVPFDRRRAFTFARDLGIRDNTLDLIWISDFDDAQAFLDWAEDPAHRKVSEELLHPIADQIARCQFQL